VLPAYYLSFWWGGIPYYYADDNYYLWDQNAAAYEVVPPPQGYVPPQGYAPDGGQPDDAAVDSAPPADSNAYPQSGQSAQQLGQDRYECHRWAADQTGFDPTRPSGGVAAADAAAAGDAYRRAEAACLAGRGYSAG